MRSRLPRGREQEEAACWRPRSARRSWRLLAERLRWVRAVRRQSSPGGRAASPDCDRSRRLSCTSPAAHKVIFNNKYLYGSAVDPFWVYAETEVDPL